MNLVARVVTDVTGIDKVFDYRIPANLASSVSVGCRVRVDLNSRRVGGWVLALLNEESSSVDAGKLADVSAVSGHGVDEELIPLCEWTARRWCGPLRSVLVSASAPRVSDLRGSPRRHVARPTPDDEVVVAARSLLAEGGGLLVVPPLKAALNVVAEASRRGPVLVLCPTKRMASLGAARLRSRGLVVALMPDDWSRAAGGVDVVIGTRSAVWSPCPDLAAIVIIDSHDDSYTEVRAPTWNAVEVARERASRKGVPCVETSPAPSLASLWKVPVVRSPEFPSVQHGDLWPEFVVEDLLEQPVRGSLVTTSLVEGLRSKSKTVLAVVNVKGRARMLACKKCAHLALCANCSTAVSLDSEEKFTCAVCATSTARICGNCGRTDFKMVRRGVTQLREEFEAAAQRTVVEVDASTSIETLDAAHCYVGTEAALHKVSSADVVCLLDFDDDLMSPRLSAVNDALSMLVRAARVAGRHGTVIVQTREINHPVIKALQALPSAIPGQILGLLLADLERRKVMSLYPVTEYALIAGLGSIPSPEIGVSVAALDEETCALKADSPDLLSDFVARLRARSGSKIRVRVNPSRV